MSGTDKLKEKADGRDAHENAGFGMSEVPCDTGKR